jgi:predicted MFS family arabinose efflux permease
MAAGLLLYAVAGPHADVWLLELSFVLAGAGLALNTGPAVGLAMAAVPLQRAGLAASVVNLARLVGITVGVAVLGSAMAAVGAQAAMAVGGAVQLIGTAVAWRGTRADEGATKEVCHA